MRGSSARRPEVGARGGDRGGGGAEAARTPDAPRGDPVTPRLSDWVGNTVLFLMRSLRPSAGVLDLRLEMRGRTGAWVETTF